MALSRTSAIALAAALAAFMALPHAARAQFEAPKPVEQMEDQPQQPDKTDQGNSDQSDQTNEDEGLPTDTGPDVDQQDEQENPPPPKPKEQPAPPAPAPQVERTGRVHREEKGKETSAAAEPPDAGAPDAGSAALAGIDGGLAEARPIIPPKSSWASLLDSWAQRRKAVQDHNPRSERVAEQAIVGEREELGIHDLAAMAAALDHESRRQLAAKNPAEANRLVDLGTVLAPDLPAPWFARAYVRLASDVSNVADAFGALRQGVSCALRQPGTRLALVGNLAVAVGLGIALAAVLVLLALALRPMRYALHDFHHLFPRGALPAQTAVLFALVLLLPWALKLGPLAELTALVCAAFLYLSSAERALATALLLVLAALPVAAGFGAGAMDYTGSVAEAIDRVEQGGPDAADAVARLEALEKSGQAGAPALIALGLDAKRAGRYAQAIERFTKAHALDPTSAAAENDLGNALLLSGDLDDARDAYLKASELAPDSAIVNFNLAKVSVRRAQLYTATRDVSDDIERSKAATAAVYRLDRSLMDRPSDNRANLFVLDLELPPGAALSKQHVDERRGIAGQVRARLWGAAAPEASMGFAAVLLLGFWGLALASKRIKPSIECDRCGRPVCGRCDREVAGTRLCGQCHNAFMKKGAVDPQTRLRKEASAKKYQERWQKGRRLASYLLAGLGHLLGGRPLFGVLFLLPVSICAAALLLGNGLFRVPFGGTLPLGREVLGGVLLVVLWILSIRSYRAGEETRRV